MIATEFIHVYGATTMLATEAIKPRLTEALELLAVGRVQRARDILHTLDRDVRAAEAYADARRVELERKRTEHRRAMGRYVDGEPDLDDETLLVARATMVDHV